MHADQGLDGFPSDHKKQSAGIGERQRHFARQTSLRRLDDQLGNAGPWMEPLEKSIFEFDADMIGGKIVIASTIPEGLVLASANAEGTKFAAKEHAASGELTSLSMLAHGDRAMLAVRHAGGAEASRILLAELPSRPYDD